MGEYMNDITKNLAAQINEFHGRATEQAEQAIMSAMRCGELLTQAKKQIGHGGWLPWLQENTYVSERSAQNYMKIAQNRKQLEENRNVADLTVRGALKQLSKGDNWQPAYYSTETVEWYTPARYIEPVRNVLGDIDLDPASCSKANEVVQAREYFTEQDNGLEKEWFGRFFLNPPYGNKTGVSMAGIFCEKAIAQYTSGNCEAGIILVNSVHSQKWQRLLFDYPLCFVDHRIKFVHGNDGENKNPTFENVFAYLGNDYQSFDREFKEVGYITFPTFNSEVIL